MKKIFLNVGIVLALLLMVTSCIPKKEADVVTVYEAIQEIGTTTGGPIDNSETYDLDERFEYFQFVQIGGDSALHLKATTGIVAYYFTPIENEDGSLTCTLKGIYVYDVGNIAFGAIEGERVSEFVDKLTFTLVLENNVVTSHDLPELIVE